MVFLFFKITYVYGTILIFLLQISYYMNMYINTLHMFFSRTYYYKCTGKTNEQRHLLAEINNTIFLGIKAVVSSIRPISLASWNLRPWIGMHTLHSAKAQEWRRKKCEYMYAKQSAETLLSPAIIFVTCKTSLRTLLSLAYLHPFSFLWKHWSLLLQSLSLSQSPSHCVIVAECEYMDDGIAFQI